MYGNSGSWCWIRVEHNENQANAFMLAFFYVFCWGTFLYNSVVTLYIRKTLSKYPMLNINTFYDKIKYFPFVLILWWIFPSVNRILQMTGNKIFAIEVLHIAFESSYGFCNMIVYGLNPTVKAIIVEIFRKIKKTEPLLVNEP